MRACSQNRRHSSIAVRLCGVLWLTLCATTSPAGACQSAPTVVPPRVIEVTADHDSQYRIHGQSKPVITTKAGEQLVLRITAIKAKSRNKDGSVHGFSLLRTKDRQPVPGWDFLLHPGMNEFTLSAPAEPGNYEVVCTVICSEDHEQMSMRFIVLPSGG